MRVNWVRLVVTAGVLLGAVFGPLWRWWKDVTW